MVLLPFRCSITFKSNNRMTEEESVFSRFYWNCLKSVLQYFNITVCELITNESGILSKKLNQRTRKWYSNNNGIGFLPDWTLPYALLNVFISVVSCSFVHLFIQLTLLWYYLVFKLFVWLCTHFFAAIRFSRNFGLA